MEETQKLKVIPLVGLGEIGKNMVVKIYKSNYVTVHAVLSDVF